MLLQCINVQNGHASQMLQKNIASMLPIVACTISYVAVVNFSGLFNLSRAVLIENVSSLAPNLALSWHRYLEKYRLHRPSVGLKIMPILND